jgi:hypothetical protein
VSIYLLRPATSRSNNEVTEKSLRSKLSGEAVTGAGSDVASVIELWPDDLGPLRAAGRTVRLPLQMIDNRAYARSGAWLSCTLL